MAFPERTSPGICLCVFSDKLQKHSRLLHVFELVAKLGIVSVARSKAATLLLFKRKTQCRRPHK